MSRLLNRNIWYYDTFPVFESDNYIKKPGLTQSDFIISVKYNEQIDSIPISIDEYASTGDYWVKFKFDKIGFWEIEISIPYNEQIWHETFDIVLECGNGNGNGNGGNGGLADLFDIRGSVAWNTARDELIAIAWILKNGELVETPGDCFWDFYDHNHDQLFSLTQLTPSANGIFKATKQSPNFSCDENYYYIVKIHGGIKLRKSPLSFITVV